MSKTTYEAVENIIKNSNQTSIIEIYQPNGSLFKQPIETFGGVFVKDFRNGVLLIFLEKESRALQKIFLTDKEVFVKSKCSFFAS